MIAHLHTLLYTRTASHTHRGSSVNSLIVYTRLADVCGVFAQMKRTLKPPPTEPDTVNHPRTSVVDVGYVPNGVNYRQKYRLLDL